MTGERDGLCGLGSSRASRQYMTQCAYDMTMIVSSYVRSQLPPQPPRRTSVMRTLPIVQPCNYLSIAGIAITKSHTPTLVDVSLPFLPIPSIWKRQIVFSLYLGGSNLKPYYCLEKTTLFFILAAAFAAMRGLAAFHWLLWGKSRCSPSDHAPSASKDDVELSLRNSCTF
jgi:hypothetical protein